MTDDIRSADTIPDDDAWLESLLRNEAAQPYLDDEGFTQRLMAALPPARQRRNHGWVIAILAALGMLVGGIGLHGMESFLQDLFRLVGGQLIPLNHLVSLLVLIGVFYWFALDLALE